MAKTYDAIVVGARVAGSPTAMLLARKGMTYCLSIGRAFPSDTISTHLVHPPGINALQRWGLLDQVAGHWVSRHRHRTRFDFGPFTLSGAPGPDGDRRVRPAADRAGQAAAGRRQSRLAREVREGFSVESIVCEDDQVLGVRGHGKGGATVTEHARVVIGADGRHSLVAQAVNPISVPREATSARCVLRLLERPADGWPLRNLRTPQPRHGGVADKR